ncbi:MAG: hypothetical protein IT384_16440 [Deltaproteobacteria bacterium]|nr:hypothetical protein [Deltaproteobacteria bacterium]
MRFDRPCVFCLALLIGAACADEPAGAPDAGGGSIDGTAGDATPVDAGIAADAGDAGDAADASAGSLTEVIVLDEGAPQADVLVVFHDQAGTPLHVARTGADGMARYALQATGSITVATSPQGTQQLVTVLGVEPEERIRVGVAEPVRSRGGSITVTTTRAVTNAGDYVVDVGCTSQTVSSVTTPLTFDVAQGCIDASGETTVLAVSRMRDGTPYSYAVGRGHPTASGAPGSVPLSPWSVGWDELFLTVTNIPNGAFGIRARAAALAGRVPFRAAFSPQIAAAFPGASSTIPLGYPRDLGEGVELFVDMAYGSQTAVEAETILIRRRTTLPSQVTIDAPAELLPAIAGFAVTSGARPEVNWTGAAALDAADGAQIDLAWTTPARGWRVLMPPSGARPARLPELPPELASWAVPTASPDQAVLYVFDIDAIPSYAALRVEQGTAALDAPLPAADMELRFSVTSAP